MNDFNQSKEADSTVSIYGSSRPLLEQTMQMLLEEIAKIREEMTEELGMDPIEHLLGRIKSEESMREKCRRKGLPETRLACALSVPLLTMSIRSGTGCWHFPAFVWLRKRTISAM